MNGRDFFIGLAEGKNLGLRVTGLKVLRSEQKAVLHYAGALVNGDLEDGWQSAWLAYHQSAGLPVEDRQHLVCRAFHSEIWRIVKRRQREVELTAIADFNASISEYSRREAVRMQREHLYRLAFSL